MRCVVVVVAVHSQTGATYRGRTAYVAVVVVVVAYVVD